MAAHVPAEETAKPLGMYIRTGSGVLGPYTLESLREMARRGVLPPGGAVSDDGVTWKRADKVLDIDSTQVAPNDKRFEKSTRAWRPGFKSQVALRALLQQVSDRAGVRYLFNLPVMFAAGLGLAVAAGYGVYAVMELDSVMTSKRLAMSLAVGLPVLLAIFAGATALANAVLGMLVGINDADRRFLALHLPRRMCERLRWGRFLKNWIYRGEWLFGPAEESPRAYIHLFRVGAPLQDTEEEVRLWEELGKSLPYGLRELCRPGDAIRQVQDVASLPSWAGTLEEVTDGYALGVVLDGNYVDWAQGFLGRARKRLGVRSRKTLEFVLSYAEPTSECKVLAVCVYPYVRSEISDLDMASSKEAMQKPESSAAA